MTYSTKILLIVITVLSLWLELSQAYCIYNRLEGEFSYLYVYEPTVNERVSFKKQINNGGSECCPWSNKDCNPTRKRESVVDFHVKFGFNGDTLGYSDTYLSFCSGGGGLVLSGGNKYNVTATCNHPNGSVQTRVITPLQK